MADGENVIKRIKPHDDKAERGVIAAMIMDRDVISEVGAIITKDDFYNSQYGYLFEGRLGWDGVDFCRGIPEQEFDSWKIHKQVPKYIAEAYCEGKIKPEDIDWDS